MAGVQQGPPPKGPYNASKVEVIVQGSDKMPGAEVEELVKKTLVEAFGESVKLNRQKDHMSPAVGKGRVTFDIQINSLGVNKDMLQQLLSDAGLKGFQQLTNDEGSKVEGYRTYVGVWPIHDESLPVEKSEENVSKE